MLSDTLILVDVFENFPNKCIKIYELDPAYFFPAQGLARQAYLKKTEEELELLADADIAVNVRERYQRWDVSRDLSTHESK